MIKLEDKDVGRGGADDTEEAKHEARTGKKTQQCRG